MFIRGLKLPGIRSRDLIISYRQKQAYLLEHSQTLFLLLFLSVNQLH